MNLAYLVVFIYEINGAIDTGKFQDISIEEVESHIKTGDLFPYLKRQFCEGIDLSLFDLAPNGITLADELTLQLQEYLESFEGFEYKLLVEKNGLCFLIALITEMIASLNWEPPRGVPAAIYENYLRSLRTEHEKLEVKDKKLAKSREVMKDRLDLTLFESLGRLDNLKKIPFETCDCFLHEDHRWVLPIIFWAQEKTLIPKPCTVVMFDAHADACDPKDVSMKEIRSIMKSGSTLEKIISLCQQLKPLDDDWVKAGMELGIIGDIVVFGARRGSTNIPEAYQDHQGKSHRIELLGLLRGELECRGHLGDTYYEDTLSDLWNILEWKRDPRGRFFLGRNASKILLDFDLDCFSCYCMNEYTIPWHDDVFVEEFLTRSTHDATRGWTGKKFLSGLIGRAGLLTIAREPGSCGGPKHGEKYADYILERVNHFLFDDNLSLSEMTCFKQRQEDDEIR